MKCKYDDGKGWCTGRLEGFACVGSKCSDHPKYAHKEEMCTKHAVNGVYCPRFKRFFCAGRPHCSGSDYFKKMMEMS